MFSMIAMTFVLPRPRVTVEKLRNWWRNERRKERKVFETMSVPEDEGRGGKRLIEVFAPKPSDPASPTR